jgi:hypothetical protein
MSRDVVPDAELKDEAEQEDVEVRVDWHCHDVKFCHD